MNALIEKGKHRGFITQVEVLNSFPNIEKDIEGLEALYERLESANINVIESGRVFEEEKVKEYDEKNGFRRSSAKLLPTPSRCI